MACARAHCATVVGSAAGNRGAAAAWARSAWADTLAMDASAPMAGTAATGMPTLVGGGSARNWRNAFSLRVRATTALATCSASPARGRVGPHLGQAAGQQLAGPLHVHLAGVVPQSPGQCRPAPAR